MPCARNVLWLNIRYVYFLFKGEAVKILVTGAAGFIGFHVCRKLLEEGHVVVGLDNLNNYYEVTLKEDRLKQLVSWSGYRYVKVDLADREEITRLFAEEGFDRVVNLAAQAGVRYSLENPHAYVDSNLVGFMNVLEGCRQNKIEHLVYASSSSVYGANETMPFSEEDNVDHPVSLYAATKKANELMAHTYSHLYGIPTTGLRFFTVYGPWGRPDMSPFLFTRAILESKPLKVYNYGKHRRDFTYIDDIVQGVLLALAHIPKGNPTWSGLSPDPSSSRAPWKIYNIGNSQPVELLHYIQVIERALGKTTKKELLPLQLGDVTHTYADVTALQRDTGYKPRFSIEEGVEEFIRWYKSYYQT